MLQGQLVQGTSAKQIVWEEQHLAVAHRLLRFSLFAILRGAPSLHPRGLSMRKWGENTTAQKTEERTQSKLRSQMWRYQAQEVKPGEGLTLLVWHHVMPVQWPKQVGCSKAVIGAGGQHN